MPLSSLFNDQNFPMKPGDVFCLQFKASGVFGRNEDAGNKDLVKLPSSTNLIYISSKINIVPGYSFAGHKSKGTRQVIMTQVYCPEMECMLYAHFTLGGWFHGWRDNFFLGIVLR